MLPELPHVTYPPDVVTGARRINVVPVQTPAGNLLALRNGFDDGETGQSAPADVVHLAGAGSAVEVIDCGHDIVAVNMIPHLFSLVSDHRVRNALENTPHQV